MKLRLRLNANHVLKLYNGEKGDAKWMKWFFYLYYPIHLIVVGVLRVCIYGDISLLC